MKPYENQARKAAGEFVRGFAPWTWFFTLTFRRGVNAEHVEQAARDWLRIIAREVVREHVPAAWGVECGAGGNWHVHGVLSIATGADVLKVAARHAWHARDDANGILDLQDYDPKRGGAGYAVKDGVWFLDTCCPRYPRCRRKGGCKEVGQKR